MLLLGDKTAVYTFECNFRWSVWIVLWWGKFNSSCWLCWRTCMVWLWMVRDHRRSSSGLWFQTPIAAR